MNDRDEEAWLDSLLQRQGLARLPDEGFQARVLQRLPPRERRGRRALVLCLSGVVAAGALLLPEAVGAGVMSASRTHELVVPFSLATALLWYVMDLLLS